MKSKRSFFIALILLLGVAMTIGYAVLNQTLKIKGNTGIAANSWIIYFDNIEKMPGGIDATSEARITNLEKTNIDFSISINKPGDYYSFFVDIVNDGTIDAMIDDVALEGIPDDIKDIIDWKVTYLNGTELQECDELLANTRKRVKVVVSYKKDIESDQLIEVDKDLELRFHVTYVQLDDTTCTIRHIETNSHKLTINPNSGKYNGSDALLERELEEGSIFLVNGTIEHEGHVFSGWTVDKENVYNSELKMITMGAEDIEVTAGWNWMGPPNCFKVGGNYYSSFVEALNTIDSDGTITLLSSNGYCGIRGSSYINIDENKDITFDLNGHSVGVYSSFMIEGTFNIDDSSDSKNGKFFTYNNATLYNYNELNILGGNYYISSGSFIYGNDDTDLMIDNAYFTGSQTSQLISVYRANPTIIKNTKFDMSPLNGAEVYVDSELVMEKVDFNIVNSTGQDHMVVYPCKKLTMSDVNFIGVGYMKPIWSNGSEMNLTNISIDIDYNGYDGNSTVYGIGGAGATTSVMDNINVNLKNIKKATVEGIYNERNMTLTNATINIGTDNGTAYGILNQGKLNASNVNVVASSTESGSAYGAYFYNEGSNIEDSEFTVLSNNQVAYGLMANNSTTYTNVKINVTSNLAYAYGMHAKGGVIDECEIVVVASGGTNQSSYGVYSGSGITINNSNIDLTSSTTSNNYGIYSGGEINLIDTVTNVNLNGTGSNKDQYGVYTYDALNTDNFDLNIKVNGSYPVTGMYYYKGGSISDSSIDIDLDSVGGGRVNGIYSTRQDAMTIEKVDIDIDSIGGGFQIYGVSSTNVNIDELNVDINSLCSAPVYGLSVSNSSISNSNIKAVGAGNAFGVSTVDGNLEIIGGSVISSGIGVYYGVENGIITIGSKDGNIINQPLIQGTQIGVNVGESVSEFNYYDGVIKGVDNSIVGNITGYEDNATRVDETETIDDVVYKVTKIR